MGDFFLIKNLGHSVGRNPQQPVDIGNFQGNFHESPQSFIYLEEGTNRHISHRSGEVGKIIDSKVIFHGIC